MLHEPLTSELSTFIDKYIDSIEQLEVLLLLFQRKEKQWSVEEVTNIIRSSEASIDRRLRRLGEDGLLTMVGGPILKFQYYPLDKKMDERVTQLSQMYLTCRLRVIEKIYSPKDQAIRHFADAFKIRKGDING